MSDPVAVLEFWLKTVGPKGWYEQSDVLDAEIVARFRELWQAAHDGGLEHWVNGTASTLAYLIITDQFPRNMFRGEARAFATDPLARAAARRALEAEWDLGAPEPERQFFYLPFEHSETMEDQALAVDLLSTRMSGPESALHARAHQDIIRRFGRFPFRNAALGRVSTAEERQFLQDGGYGAVVRAMQS